MSDWLLQGVDPRALDGREFYLHTADDWFDILMVVDVLLPDRFPLQDDIPLGYLEDHECQTLATLLDELIDANATRDLLDLQFTVEAENRFDDDDGRIFIDPDTGQPVDFKRQRIEGRIDGCVDNLRRFSLFLKSCGGFLADCA